MTLDLSPPPAARCDDGCSEVCGLDLAALHAGIRDARRDLKAVLRSCHLIKEGKATLPDIVVTIENGAVSASTRLRVLAATVNAAAEQERLGDLLQLRQRFPDFDVRKLARKAGMPWNVAHRLLYAHRRRLDRETAPAAAA